MPVEIKGCHWPRCFVESENLTCLNIPIESHQQWSIFTNRFLKFIGTEGVSFSLPVCVLNLLIHVFVWDTWYSPYCFHGLYSAQLDR